MEAKWGKTYPIVVQSWCNKWDNLSAYFKYPDPIRKIIYTINAVGGSAPTVSQAHQNQG